MRISLQETLPHAFSDSNHQLPAFFCGLARTLCLDFSISFSLCAKAYRTWYRTFFPLQQLTPHGLFRQITLVPLRVEVCPIGKNKILSLDAPSIKGNIGNLHPNLTCSLVISF